MAAVIDFESISSTTSMPVIAPEEPIAISAAAIASVVPSAIATISAVLTLKCVLACSHQARQLVLRAQPHDPMDCQHSL